MDELQYISNRLREHMNTTADHMSTGGCEDFNQYNYCAGMIKAFALIEREIIDLREKLEKAE